MEQMHPPPTSAPFFPFSILPLNAISYYGFARKLAVQSRSMDAEVVVDGAMSYPWVDGDTAILEILPEDALTTVKLI